MKINPACFGGVFLCDVVNAILAWLGENPNSFVFFHWAIILMIRSTLISCPILSPEKYHENMHSSFWIPYLFFIGFGTG